MLPLEPTCNHWRLLPDTRQGTDSVSPTPRFSRGIGHVLDMFRVKKSAVAGSVFWLLFMHVHAAIFGPVNFQLVPLLARMGILQT